MKFMKKFLVAGVFLTSAALAQEGSDIRNVCDTLIHSTNSKVTLKLAYLDETKWDGSKDLKTPSSVEKKRYTELKELTPLRYMLQKVPYSLTAGCSNSRYNEYKYYSWAKGASSWSQGTMNDYATAILDIHGNKMNGYDSTNTYNFLVFHQGSLPEESYQAGEIMASRTYDFRFDWWYAAIAYYRVTRVDSTVNADKSVTYTTYGSWSLGGAVAMDSASVVAQARASLDIPDSIKDVKLQVLHAVYMDERKIGEVISSSASAEPNSSASAEPNTSASVDPNTSASYDPESSAEWSSSANELTSIAELNAVPRMFGHRREVRRLDGSFVKESEALAPGVYYVKGENGLWKKQIALPR